MNREIRKRKFAWRRFACGREELCSFMGVQFQLNEISASILGLKLMQHLLLKFKAPG